MNERIDNFLEKWNEMMDAANEIPEFKWKFSVSITSDNSLIPERIKTINGINESFSRHNMSWESTSD